MADRKSQKKKKESQNGDAEAKMAHAFELFRGNQIAEAKEVCSEALYQDENVSEGSNLVAKLGVEMADVFVDMDKEVFEEVFGVRNYDQNVRSYFGTRSMKHWSAADYELFPHHPAVKQYFTQEDDILTRILGLVLTTYWDCLPTLDRPVNLNLKSFPSTSTLFGSANELTINLEDVSMTELPDGQSSNLKLALYVSGQPHPEATINLKGNTGPGFLYASTDCTVNVFDVSRLSAFHCYVATFNHNEADIVLRQGEAT